MKKIFLVSLSFVSAHVCHASVMFSEIMYDLEGTDTDHEWVEVYNGGPENIDLSTWKFFEGNTNHSLVPVDGSGMLAANTYAIIADKPDTFRIDWPNYTGPLFDSSFSLNNDPGESLSLKDANLAIIDTVTYVNTSGAQGDGKSLQKIDSTWIAALPTPGAVNTTDSTNDGTENTDGGTPPSTSGGSGGSAPSTPPKKSIEPATPKIQADIIAPITIFSGIAFPLKTKTTGYTSENMSYGQWVWSFGDGATLEQKTNTPFTYVYDYPGTYVVTLSYKTNQYLPEPDATDRIIVTVIAPEITISSLLPDSSVVLRNISSKEIDLSHWTLARGATTFVFPSATIFLPNKDMIISQKISHLSVDVPVILATPQGEIISTFPMPIVPKSSPVTVSTSNRSSSLLSVTNKSYAPITLETAEKKPDTLLASVTAAPVAKNLWKKVLPFVGFGLVSCLGGYAWWRYSQPKKIEDEDDYEIVE